ncbi:antitoxin Xre/MbcA/ParS toxin-binding domain-containing protein [Ancylomarina sp. YFZ004]
MKELLKKGIAIFGTKAIFLNWIETENEALGNITPDSLLDSTQGVSIVYDLLMKLEQNITS